MGRRKKLKNFFSDLLRANKNANIASLHEQLTFYSVCLSELFVVSTPREKDFLNSWLAYCDQLPPPHQLKIEHKLQCMKILARNYQPYRQ